MTIVMESITLPTSKGRERFWAAMACPRCAGMVAIEHDSPTVRPGMVLTVVPEHRSQERVDHVPDDIAAYYKDAITVLEAGVPDAAAVQLRRTLEAASQYFGVKPYPLVHAVKGLVDKGLITTQFGDVLGHIRKVGNIGAHATDTKVSMDEARLVLRFTTQVLRNLFEIPAELATLGEAKVSEDELKA